MNSVLRCRAGRAKRLNARIRQESWDRGREGEIRGTRIAWADLVLLVGFPPGPLQGVWTRHQVAVEEAFQFA